MANPSDPDVIIDRCLDEIERSRGDRFTPEQRARVHEIAHEPLFVDRLEEMPPEEQLRQVDSLARLASIGLRESFPAPDAITTDVLRRTPDSELANLIYDYVCNWLDKMGGYRDDAHQGAVLNLPRGQRVVFTIFVLEGEVHNGGFSQFFGNSSGMFVPETLEDCRLVGADKRAAFLEQAYAVWRPFQDIFSSGRANRAEAQRLWDAMEPELDKLTSAFFGLEKEEPVMELLVRYLRAHPDDCLTQ